MTTGDMKNRSSAKKLPNDYPRVCFRIAPELRDELDRVRAATRLSYGQIISQSLRRYVPELSKFHKV